MILRRWPTEHPTRDRLRFIHAVLDHVARRGIGFLPLPIRANSGETFVEHAGHLWELAPWLPGTADFDHAPSAAKLHAALSALARLHVALADFHPERPLAAALQGAGPAPAITRRLARLQELQSQGTHELARAITTSIWPEIAPLARRFLAALPNAIQPAIAQLAPLADVRFPLQPCLRDIWHDHVLFTGNEVTGIIDFGAVDVDTPACDIARLLGSLGTVPVSPPGTVPFSQALRDCSPLRCEPDQSESAKSGLPPSRYAEIDTWRDGLAAYAAVRPLAPDEIRAAHALDTSGTLLAGCNWIRWIYIEGRHFEDHATVLKRLRQIALRAAAIHAIDESTR